MKYFLEQCLYTVQKALQGMDAEIWVVDNASNDHSVSHIQALFPSVHIIANENNLGFARANNRALAKASGEYILFLNPDTLIPENVLQQCVAWMEEHPDAGAAGVRMIDGSGRFLPESKRAFPTPLNSFFKLCGAAALFPGSGFFNRYALGHLNEKGTYAVEVLAGACLFVRKKVLDTVGGFDESFFMYGEDIDLSYRIHQSGYANYYLGFATILHFKGESRQAGGFNHVRQFYKAMHVFVQKHYQTAGAAAFGVLLRIAISMSTFLAFIQQWVLKRGLPIVDAILILVTLYGTDRFWVQMIKHGVEFDTFFVPYALPLYTVIYLLAATVSGMYDQLYKPSKALFSSITAIIVLLAFYSLLPEQVRFSRGVVLVGGMAAACCIMMARWVLVQLNWLSADTRRSGEKLLVLASQEAYAELMTTTASADLKKHIMGRVSFAAEESALCSVAALPAFLRKVAIGEVICVEDKTYPFRQIMDFIQEVPERCRFRFHTSGSSSIVGSHSKLTKGASLSVSYSYSISHPYQQRMKRMVDVMVASFLLFSFPVQLLFIPSPFGALKNALQVLKGNLTWVGYAFSSPQLPNIQKSILTSCGTLKNQLPVDVLLKADELYALEYDWMNDISLILKNYKNLGAKQANR